MRADHLTSKKEVRPEISRSDKGIKNILRGSLKSEFLGTAETRRQFKNMPRAGMATKVSDKRRFFFLTGTGTGGPHSNEGEIEAR